MRHLPLALVLVGGLLGFAPVGAECFNVTVPIFDGQTWTSGCDVQVNGVVVPDTCGSVTRIQWDWGDGTVEDHWFPAPHTYEENGLYAVTVTPFDVEGSNQSESFQLEVTECEGPGTVQHDHPWTFRQPMPTARGSQGAAVVDGNIYVIGGEPVSAVEVYDTRLDSWTSLAPLPNLREVVGVATVGGKIYAIGGHRYGTYLADNDEYDPATNTWIPRTPMPTARGASGSTVAVGGLIYVIGGFNHAGQQLDVVEVYDPSTDTWAVKAPLPTRRSGHFVAAVQGKIYAIGGGSPSGVIDVVEEYDPATDMWTTRAPMPSAKSGLGGTAIGGKIYAFGGWYSTSNVEYDPATDTWVSRTPMPAWCVASGVAPANGVVHLFGGTGDCPRNQNLVYRPPGASQGGAWSSAGPEGGYVYDVAADPTTPGVFYAGTSNGVFKSTDAGATWSRSRGTAANPGPDFSARVVEVGPDGRVYASGQPDDFYWSADGGDNWSSGNTGIAGNVSVRAIAVDPSPPFSTLYIGANQDVYRSDDGGQTWVAANGTAPNTLPGSTIQFVVVSGTNIFVGIGYSSSGRVWKSSDGGANWFPAQGMAPNQLPNSSLRDMAVGPAGEFYVAIYFDGVFRTDDAGDTWQAVNGTPPNDLPPSFVIRSLTIDAGGDLYLGGWDGVFKGTNGGESWARLTMPVDALNVFSISTDPALVSRVFAGTDAGILRSEDAGASWTEQNIGMRAFYTYGLVLDSGAPESVHAAGLAGIVKSNDSAVSWEYDTQLLQSRYASDLAICPSRPPDDGNTLYAVSYGWPDAVARREEGDNSWSYPTVDPLFFNPYFSPPEFASVEVDPTNPNRVFVGMDGYPGWVSYGDVAGGVFQSNDGGANWTHVYEPPPSPQIPDPAAVSFYEPWSLGIDPLDTQRIYVAGIWQTQDGQRNWNVVRSADGGATWQEVLSADGSFGLPDMAFDTNDPSMGGTVSTTYVHLSFSPYDLFRSVDGGLTWEQLPTPPAAIAGLAPDPTIGGALYGLFVDDTVRLSRDRGATWEPLSMVGFDSTFAWGGLAISPTSPRMIHAATHGGVYSYTTLGPQTQQPEDVARPGTFPASLTFDHVVATGDTTLTTTTVAPTLPAEVALGTSALFHDLTTTTLFVGEVEVCVDYDPDDYTWPATDLMLYRLNDGVWQDVTSHVDTVAQLICGNVTELSLFAVVEPREFPDLEIPIRWCGVSGAPSIDDPTVVGESSVNAVLLGRQTRATDNIFLPQTGLIFRSGTTASAPSFPILTDPSTAVGAVGDVFVDPDSGNYTEFFELIQACREAWAAADPTVVGITAVNINRFVDGAGVPINLLGIGGRADAGNCSQQMVAGRAMVVDAAYRPADTIDKLLGHELGHGLSLRHGDGIDTDANGVLDDENDPLDGFNVMQYQETGSILTSPQGAQMREHALACIPDVTIAGAPPTSGSQGTDPLGDAGTPGWADLTDFGMYRSLGRTNIFNGTAAPVPNGAEVQYWNQVDVDDDPITGGHPAQLGFPTDATGIELITSTTVTVVAGVHTATTTVWLWDGAAFVVQIDPGIQSESTPTTIGLFQDLSGPLAATSDPTISETVVVSIPNELLPALAETVTINTQTQDVATGATDSGEAQLDFTPPVFPEVTVTPGIAGAGETVVVEASGLPSNSTVEVLLGTELVATGSTDGDGDATIPFMIPLNAAGGERLVTAAVIDDDVAVTAVTSLIIPTAPTFDVPPTPNRGSALEVPAGNPIELTIRASDVDVNDVVTLGVVGLPQDAGFDSTAGNPATGLFSWTPTSDQGGTWGITFTATDDRGSVAPPMTISVEVVTNQPPLALCQDRTVSTDAGLCLASDISVDAGSSDPDADPLVFAQTPPGPYALGATAVTLTLTDDSGLSDSCAATVTVSDTEAPTVQAPGNLIYECNTQGGATLTDPGIQAWLATVTADDNCAIATLVNDAPGFLFVGPTPVTFTATDESENSGNSFATVIVGDTVPPTIVSVTATPNELWPPNHRMEPVHFEVEVTDTCDADPAVSLVSVDSSEPDDAPGNIDGRTDSDIQDADIGTGDFDILLRSERVGNGPGRIYTATYAATDAAGNSSTASAVVEVPHDQGGIVEPVIVKLTDEDPTTLRWNETPGALGFDVIRGDLSNVTVTGSTLTLGPVVCLEHASPDNLAVETEDTENPPQGSVYFYLVGTAYPGFETSYGTESAVKSRVVEEGHGNCS